MGHVTAVVFLTPPQGKRELGRRAILHVCSNGDHGMRGQGARALLLPMEDGAEARSASRQGSHSALSTIMREV